MNKFIKWFFGLDLWIALTLITTMVVDIFFSRTRGNGMMISFSIGLALLNIIACVVIINSVTFYKNKEIKSTN